MTAGRTSTAGGEAERGACSRHRGVGLREGSRRRGLGSMERAQSETFTRPCKRLPSLSSHGFSSSHLATSAAHLACTASAHSSSSSSLLFFFFLTSNSNPLTASFHTVSSSFNVSLAFPSAASRETNCC
ncbi:hypothetical protein BCR35DRAFT_302722 [Leucosporidium creatinivorum]|uniref:Uncharacterized protein n=1 Tax=Leucosporidium creatinivorum TaxID=106004 RepID=A0A1Y2FRZ2_9BASI|nr:hypothetical protein BCR35DRAFT_302722 [Leucosporidium creatinivorum]